MNEDRYKQREQNGSRLVFVIPKVFGIARLGEHNVSRRHESGFSVVRRLGLWKSQFKGGTVSQPTGPDNLRWGSGSSLTLQAGILPVCSPDSGTPVLREAVRA